MDVITPAQNNSHLEFLNFIFNDNEEDIDGDDRVVMMNNDNNDYEDENND
ncbi:hypothetical protein Glove_33g136 [Diversispora epigaea]|uniref:Uncharacterized protein n=1 Tax=Diversispora epigaea TaxID=1348612 RepID=A0A397JQY4_9GLOM|nr:hypothetical protein Glove_33g136 [Diversispora epigaea]